MPALPLRVLRPLRKTRPDLVRALPRAAAVIAAAALAVLAAGCGGGGGESTDDALTSLYAIDHAGMNPAGNELAPYEAVFAKLRDDCNGSVEELVSSIQDTASSASNGSGTTITNLEAMRAVAQYLKRNPQPSEDCAGVFVGVEAYLEGGALG